MPVRDGPLKPMTMSGHCTWPTKGFGHGFCSGKVCTCPCHVDPTYDTSRVHEVSSGPLTLSVSGTATKPQTVSPQPDKPKIQLRKRRAK